tara:strand:+ start:219 stop:956 length:738 start_codon:yes stop_codon:yes gene_type:complete
MPKASHLDDILGAYDEGKIDSAFKKHDDFMKEENVNHMLNRIIDPSLQSMYDTFKSKLDAKTGGNDEAKASAHKKDIDDALFHSLKDYFTKFHPSQIGRLEGMTQDEQLDHLMGLYDSVTGANREGSRATSIRQVQAMAKRSKSTVGHVLNAMREKKNGDAGHIIQYVAGRKQAELFGNLHDEHLHKYVVGKIGKSEFEVDEKTHFNMLGRGEYIGLVKALKSGNFGEHGPEQYGLKKKEPAPAP